MKYQYMPREKELHFWIVEEGKHKHLIYHEVGVHEVEENVREMRERLAEDNRRQKGQ
ncbi:TPA: hypothetical protein QDB51_002651 [Burkholderia vietnamiensis]|uniref:hypothetical protein n=1 Tax=Burkholderia multivorans TaxID=87883 RepID=UPI0015E42661|nr:hypothetical protein [Burkholderia multivorans]HDR9188576.1 hypothetical protein [Burkholderia vietnamiensis]